MLTEIGTLVSIVKGLSDVAKTGSEFFGGKNKTAADAVGELKQRIAGVAEQLQQSVALSKMLPIWLKEHSQFDLFTSQLTDDDVKLFDSALRDLINDSVHDHFSGTFFRTSFAALPGVEAAIKSFQERLVALEHQLDGVPPGDMQAWRLAWPVLKVRLADLRKEAVKINSMADQLHSMLLTELRQAGV